MTKRYSMDFSKSNDDPHGVQRLLDILRRQQDASRSVPSPSHSSGPSSMPSHAPLAYAQNPFSPAPSTSYKASDASDSIAAEQGGDAAVRRRTYNHPSSKYGLSPAHAASDPPFDPYAFNPFSAANPVLSQPATEPTASTPPPKPAVQQRDLGSLSFAEALPILSTLSTDTNLLRRLRALRAAQHDLEKKLAKEYRLFAATADKQYPNPKLRAQEDANRRKRIVQQWDECVSRQQQELERAGVPAVRKTAKGEKREIEKQRKVLNVLVDMLDDQEQEQEAKSSRG